MKATLLAAAVLALAVMFFCYRRRLRTAVFACGVLYGLLIVARLVLLREDVDRLTSLALALGAVGALWLIVNVVVSLIQRGRSKAR